jgi:polyketide synthase PksN
VRRRHAESAAGIAGVAKILCSSAPGNRADHSPEKVNPHIDFDSSPFYLQHELGPGTRRRPRQR